MKARLFSARGRNNGHEQGGTMTTRAARLKSGLAPARQRKTLGTRLRQLRQAKRWTLETVAQRTGLARSTLSKIENEQMSPTFDVLQKVALGFEMDVSTLVAHEEIVAPLGRRSLTRTGQGKPYAMPNYDHEFLCADLARRKFTPIRTRIRARSFAEFPEWVRHSGEDFVLVMEGEIDFYSEFYEVTRLAAGDSIYYDSTMGHALVSVSPEDALVLWVTAT
jgi:transcriptional regulator with XRE-family HTH domain